MEYELIRLQDVLTNVMQSLCFRIINRFSRRPDGLTVPSS